MSLPVREQFPILQQTLPKGLPVTFLDTAASAQKPQCVIDREAEVYERFYANAYRGVYRFGAEVDEQLEATREAIRQLIHAENASDIAFTAGATLSLNMIAQGWQSQLRSGDEIVISLLEHHANLVPWQVVAQRTGAVLKYLPLTETGELDLAQCAAVISPRTRVVAVTGMSNVLGTLPPLQALAKLAHAAGAIFVVDAAQSVPHLPTDVQELGIDFLACSGHKLYGPSGVGFLYGRPDLLDRLDPLVFGGHMIDRVELQSSTYTAPPARFEAGTLPIAPAIALRTAIEFLQNIGFAPLHTHELELTRYAHERLSHIPGLRIYGPPPERKGAIVTFTMAGAAAEDIAHLLDRRGVFVRHGHHCAMPLHDWLGVPATVRASFGLYNSREDIDRLADALLFVRERLRLD